jgi:hypothetical protein
MNGTVGIQCAFRFYPSYTNMIPVQAWVSILLAAHAAGIAVGSREYLCKHLCSS